MPHQGAAKKAASALLAFRKRAKSSARLNISVPSRGQPRSHPAAILSGCAAAAPYICHAVLTYNNNCLRNSPLRGFAVCADIPPTLCSLTLSAVARRLRRRNGGIYPLRSQSRSAYILRTDTYTGFARAHSRRGQGLRQGALTPPKV